MGARTTLLADHSVVAWTASSHSCPPIFSVPVILPTHPHYVDIKIIKVGTVYTNSNMAGWMARKPE